MENLKGLCANAEPNRYRHQITVQIAEEKSMVVNGGTKNEEH